tara:strand:+ start:662 stop:868 length:207 start_codon:yes stop_codon:yes gene_type:complete
MSDQLDNNDDLDETVCICSGTTKRKIIQLIEDGCDLDTVSRKTGAFSGCGGCEYELEELFNAYQSTDD